MSMTTLEQKLSAIYNSKGLKPFLETCHEVITKSEFRGETVSAQDRGGVCELVLLRVTQSYLKLTGNQGQVFRSVVLKDLRSRTSQRVNEVDCLLVAPGFLLAVECKSYRGKADIVDRGTLQTKFGKTDMYNQSLSHKDILDQYAKQLAMVKQRQLPVFYCGFLYADTTVEDKRRQAAKVEFPIITQSELVNLYSKLYKRYSATVYDYERACTIIGKCSRSRNLHTQHAERLGYDK